MEGKCVEKAQLALILHLRCVTTGGGSFALCGEADAKVRSGILGSWKQNKNQQVWEPRTLVNPISPVLGSPAGIPQFSCFSQLSLTLPYILAALPLSKSRNEPAFTACFLHSLINCKIHYWGTRSKSPPYIPTLAPGREWPGLGIDPVPCMAELWNGPAPCFWTSAQVKKTHGPEL